MAIDAQTGALRWQPTPAQLGEHEISIHLTDAYGLYTAQEYTLTVKGANTPPAIVSTAITQAAVGQNYVYNVVAKDVENDALSYSLVKRVDGMAIDGNGQMRWTPTAVGSYEVSVQVSDAQGASAFQNYQIVVVATAINRPPTITSTPVFLADTNKPYTYQVQAADPEGDAIAYELIEQPVGMTISAGGLITWATPVTGNYRVVVGAKDSKGLGAAQGFSLTARSDQKPITRSEPLLTAATGTLYAYDVQAVDPEGTKLTYAIDPASVARGMSLDDLGRLRWTPSATQVGAYPVSVTVTDAVGNVVVQAYTLTVTADGIAPVVKLGFTGFNPTELNSSVTFFVSATDNVGVVSRQLLVDGKGVILDDNGNATVEMAKVGVIPIIAKARDAAGNEGSDSLSLTVFDPTDVDAPEVSFELRDRGTTLPDEAVITSVVDVFGTVKDTNLAAYTVSVAPVGSDAFVEVARGGSAVIVNGKLASFDPATFGNDAYVMRVTAEDLGGKSSSFERVVNVSGDLKLGNFRLSFTDIAVAVAGIPVSVSRTYDSLTSVVRDDLGYGWRLEFRDTDLRTSVGPDIDPLQIKRSGEWPRYPWLYDTIPRNSPEIR